MQLENDVQSCGVDNVLIKDVNGTPSDGYGRVFYDWMTGTAWQ